MRSIKKLILIIALLVSGSLLWFYYQQGPYLYLKKTTFTDLPHWGEDDHEVALLAFQKSCVEILKRPSGQDFGKLKQAKKVSDWQKICLAAKNAHAKAFFETWFQPYALNSNFSSEGLFTGYYLPLLRASEKKDKTYTFPIHGLPQDLIRINLGDFRPELAGKVITGQLKKNRLLPYPDRKQIQNGAISKQAPVLLWGDSAIDIFFAQIQGSFIAELPDGKRWMLGYAGANGQPYTPIGRVLIQKQMLDKKAVSMQGIKNWLLQHPEQMNTILNANASYVFFQVLKTKEPLGAEQIPLTQARSLAVDTRYLPLGAPVWLQTKVPQKDNDLLPYAHLLIAQDTGGAIKGMIRGDIYWGTGETAAFRAGHMNSPGRYWLLLPK